MANLATVEDVEKVLIRDISDPDEVASVEFHLTEVSAAVRSYVEQFIELVSDDELSIDCNGGVRIILPELPVVSVAEVIEDEITLTAEEDYKLGQYGFLYRIGATWKVGIQNVSITYTHGFDSIPDDIVGVVARAASRGFQAGLKAAEDEGIPGIASKSLGDFSVSYVSEGGSAGDGMMGASAARMLLLSEKDILDKYRAR